MSRNRKTLRMNRNACVYAAINQNENGLNWTVCPWSYCAFHNVLQCALMYARFHSKTAAVSREKTRRSLRRGAPGQASIEFPLGKRLGIRRTARRAGVDLESISCYSRIGSPLAPLPLALPPLALPPFSWGPAGASFDPVLPKK